MATMKNEIIFLIILEEAKKIEGSRRRN